MPNGDVIEGGAAVRADFLGARKLEDGIGLCLSGGGYRAMLFHVGALTRLNELGLLPRLSRVASVSGGSLAAGALAVGWRRLRFDGRGVADNFADAVAAPLVALARKRVDVPAILLGLLPGVTAAGVAARAYDRQLFKGATLQDLPAAPRFTFTATSLQTGALWRFSREYAAEYRVGQWEAPDLPLATVVAASAAFPPFMSPALVEVPAGRFRRLEGADLHDEDFSGRLWLTDGGVYDNLGLEPVWKRYRTVLVSDGGAALPALPAPGSNWLSQANRVANVALQQGVAIRPRVPFGLARSGERTLAYWGINQGVETYGAGNPLGFGADASRGAAAVPTRLTCLPHRIQELVVKAGYAHADAALGASGLPMLDHPPSFDPLASLWPGADGKAAGGDASEPRRGQ